MSMFGTFLASYIAMIVLSATVVQIFCLIQGVVIVYDITNPDSFSHFEMWEKLSGLVMS